MGDELRSILNHLQNGSWGTCRKYMYDSEKFPWVSSGHCNSRDLRMFFNVITAIDNTKTSSSAIAITSENSEANSTNAVSVTRKLEGSSVSLFGIASYDANTHDIGIAYGITEHNKIIKVDVIRVSEYSDSSRIMDYNPSYSIDDYEI